MNFKTTFFLVLLAGGAAMFVYFADNVAPKMGLGPVKKVETAPSDTLAALAELKPDAITGIRINNGTTAVVELRSQGPGRPLELPGNWPRRENEVNELVYVLTHLRTRFDPIQADSTKLREFGLMDGDDLITCEIDAAGTARKLKFGRPAVKAGENPFGRPLYLQVDNLAGVLQVDNEILRVLQRPAETYRKRQLFPTADRLRVAESVRNAQEAMPAFVLGEAVIRVEIRGPQGNYVLARTGSAPKEMPTGDKGKEDSVVVQSRFAEAWKIVEPIRDSADPVKLRQVLAAVPDIWVEQFLLNPDAVSVAASGLAGTFMNGSGYLDTVGLGPNSPEKMSVTLVFADQARRTLVIGRTTRVNTRTEPAPPPMFPGAPPQPPKIIEEKFHFAKLADSGVVFEIKGERLPELFFTGAPTDPKAELPGRAVDQLRDANPIRIDTEAVTAIEVSKAGPRLRLTKTKGDPKGTTEDARRDRWDIRAPFASLAETKQVTDLIEPLDRMTPRKGDIIDRPLMHAVIGSMAIVDTAVMGLEGDSVLRIDLKGDPKRFQPDRSLLLGNRDAVAKRVFVSVPGSDRVSIVDDAVLTALEREPRVYRSLRLFDLGENRVDSITVQRPTEQYRLAEVVGATTTYVLQQPVQADADADKAKNLLRDLGTLEAIEFVYEPLQGAETAAVRTVLGPIAESWLGSDDTRFGFDKNGSQVTLSFAGPRSMAPRKLSIGKARDGKPEYYARIDGSPTVFSIKKEVAEAVTGGSLGLLPLQVATVNVDGIQQLEVTKGEEKTYRIDQNDKKWKLAPPYEGAVDATVVVPMTGGLGTIRAERYAAHKATDPVAFGFDKPALRLKVVAEEKTPAKDGVAAKSTQKTIELTFGKLDPEAKIPGRFARLGGDDKPVFVIAEPMFNDLNRSALELLDKKLLSIIPTTVTKVETTGPDGLLTLEKSGQEWKPTGSAFPVDKVTVDSILRITSNLNALKYADYGDAVDWKKYGLDAGSKPQLLTVHADKDAHKLEIGGVVPNTPNDRYARVNSGKAVAVLPSVMARDLAKGRLDMVDRTIFKFDPIDLQAMRRTMAGKDLELALEGTNWSILKPAKLPADQNSLEELADRLANLRAERAADTELKDAAKYGLANPHATIKLEIIGKGGRPADRTMKIGGPVDPAKPDGDRYVQVEGSSTVLVLAGGTAKRLTADTIKFREKGLGNFVTADRIVITRDGKDMEFQKTAGAWRMKLPRDADAEEEPLRELHDMLARLRAEELVAEAPADLKPYGLDRPERWRVLNGDKVVLNLLVGGREKIGGPGKEKEGFRTYAKLDKGNMVVLLDMALSNKLTAEYRKRGLWEPLDVAQAVRIEVETYDGHGGFRFQKGALGWTDPASFTDRLKNDVITDLLDAFAGLKVERFVDGNPKDGPKIYGLDPPRRTVRVSTTSMVKRTILLGRTDDKKRVYAMLDDPKKPEVFLLSEADTERLLRDRSGFLEGPRNVPMDPKKEPEPKKVVDPKKDSEPKKEPEPKKVVDPKKDSEPKKEPEPKKVVDPKKDSEPKKVIDPKKEPEPKKQSESKDVVDPKKANDPKKNP